MTYDTQLTELAGKMAREQYPEYEKRLRFRQREYIESMRPLAAIALAFAAEKVRKSISHYTEGIIINNLTELGLIPDIN
jgi:hypothetical protein